MQLSPASPLVVGLTGGIASGKTTVSDLFAALGVPIIDADIEARQAVQSGSPGLERLVQAFGQQILTPEGELDRAAMRQRVFSHPDDLQTINAILHPIIGQQMQEKIAQQDADYVIAVIPLLCETPTRNWIDRILLVHASEPVRRQRLLQRDGIDRQLADKMLAAQCSDQQRLALADDLVLNESDIESLQARVKALHTFYQSLARAN
jgi:dephospho-CoA kinase